MQAHNGAVQGASVNESTKHRPGAAQMRSESASRLRQRAEALLATRLRNRLDKIETADVDWLVHELGVYQVELEAQNEELLGVQQALENSRNRYRLLYEQAPVGYVTTGLNGNIVEANQLAAEIIGVR